MKKKLLSFFASAALCASMLVCSAYAADLDNIGTSPSTSATAVDNTAVAPASPDVPTGNASDAASGIVDAYKDVGLSDADMAAATETVKPIVRWVNYGIGIIVALLGTLLLAVTILDLIYIISPSFIRNIGANSMQQNGQPGGLAGLISDDCKAALAECGAPAAPGAAPMGGMGSPMGGMGAPMGGMGMGAPMGGMGMGAPMGGMGMGGMGMGGMGGAPAAPKAKTVALCYLKKRVFSLVIIGVCIVVLTCTCFLDVGMKIGTWAVNLLSGAI